MEAAQGIDKRIKEMYDPNIIANFSTFVDKKARNEQQKKAYYTTISNILYLVEYERIHKQALEQETPRLLNVGDDLIQADMNFSRYTPNTKIEDIHIDRNLLIGSWSRTVGYFPISKQKLAKIKTIAELAEQIICKTS